jgi:hypothetical protein
VLLALVVATLIPAGTPGLARRQVGPCELQQEIGEPLRHFSKRRIACAVEEFGPVPGGKQRAICIAERESGLNPKASSKTGMYLGLFQHSATYWPSRYEAYTDPGWGVPDSALHGRANSIVTIRMVASAGGWGVAGWRRGEC